MAEIGLIRIDFRLVHGQVAVKWSKAVRADKLIVVNDAVAADDVMKSIFKMAAPNGAKVLCYSRGRCMEKWREKEFGTGNVMMLFKTVADAYALWKEGFPMKHLQLGNCPKAEGKKRLGSEIYVTEEEMALLRDMSACGVSVDIQTIPEQHAVSFEKAALKG